MKPNITLTLDRRLDLPGEETARIALTLNAWVSREVADPDTADVQSALMRACTMVEQELLGTGPRFPETCERCRFWRESPASCHRRPPSSTGEWPAARPTDWCGEFQPQR